MACLFEGGLLILALGLSQLTDQAILSRFRWDWRDFLAGSFAAVPPFLFFVWSLGSSWGPAVEIRIFLEVVLRPLFATQSLLQLSVISLLAGLGEEALFRGVIQGAMVVPLGWWGALLVASLIFGMAHAVNRSYTLIASVVGLYLGALYLVSQNLLVPVACHAVYDTLALVYFLRVVPPTPR
jgi:membrane protease YdiL (CAAX protease family)